MQGKEIKKGRIKIKWDSGDRQESRWNVVTLPADEDTEEVEPAASVGLNGSRDRRSLLSLDRGESEKLWDYLYT